MVVIEVKCKYCHATEFVRKHGFGRAGFPRYYCKFCQKSFQINYRYNGHKQGIKERIVILNRNGSSLRDTVRTLGVGINTVMRTLKE